MKLFLQPHPGVQCEAAQPGGVTAWGGTPTCPVPQVTSVSQGLKPLWLLTCEHLRNSPDFLQTTTGRGQTNQVYPWVRYRSVATAAFHPRALEQRAAAGRGPGSTGAAPARSRGLLCRGPAAAALHV